MGSTKKELFTVKQNEIAGLAKAIAHPARIAILQHLVKINACVCGDLTEELGLAQATVSQHLKELKAVGLIQGTVDGTSVCYCIEPRMWNKLRQTFSDFFVILNTVKNCC
ncbi:ArsR/SmtB family transcription factor [Mucilaginibacter ginkgonis]|uniref:Winged helix-turn-helix transcriptional regulator n=1 Tax=Mucilaginibacter ginkgonis TaxID=2682091 RepID=A0A6I4I5F3_9SPHI|nr:metalloregulator ArsR/SmtB family transcription factor [Mucilaginibacter ginkgonis]QQL49157.1 winged helix-turn-helix transcriptional regulator [Mucilaginibacter ginkgonis]